MTEAPCRGTQKKHTKKADGEVFCISIADVGDAVVKRKENAC